nr:ribonuclease H-like domain-containing protein [Tanacetum cinerariifolium]
MDANIKKDDLNQKFLTSLAPEWLIHTIVWRNRNDLDFMSLDDLYNHLKVYEAKVQKKPNSNSQDMAFISSKNNNNEDGNTKDLSWTGLLEFVDDTVTYYSRPSPTVASISSKDQNKDTSTSEEVASTNPSKPFVKFVKPKDSQLKSKLKEHETPKKPQVKYFEQNRKSNKRPKGNQRNWNNLKSYQLGPEFVLHKKPCFNYGDFSHLAKDYRRRVQRETNRSQNHLYKSSTHRSASHRPNGAHMRPPLRSSGLRPHGNSMRPPFRPAGHRPHGPSMNPKRPTMNGARPYKTFFQTPSFETRPFLKSSAAVPRTTLMTKVIGTVAALGT